MNGSDLSDPNSCSLAGVVREIRRQNPEFELVSLLDALDEACKGPPRIAVATLDMQISPEQWAAALRSESIESVLTDTPVEELRVLRGFRSPMEAKVIPASPFLEVDAPSKSGSVDGVAIAGPYGGEENARQALIALELWVDARGSGGEAELVRVSRAGELLQALLRVRQGGLCVGALGCSALSIAARWYAAQLGVRYVEVKDRAEPLRLQLMGPLPAEQRCSLKRLREAVLAFQRAVPESTGRDLPAAEARRIAFCLGMARQRKDEGLSAIALVEPSDLRDERGDWAFGEESGKAVLDLFDQLSSTSDEWRARYLPAVLAPLCSRVVTTVGVAESSQLIRRTFFRYSESWNAWQIWIRDHEITRPSERGLPGCVRCLQFSKELFAPHPLERNWDERFRRQNVEALEKALSLVRLLGEHQSILGQSTYFQVRYLIFLERRKEAMELLDRFIVEQETGDAFLEPFLLDLWFCGGRPDVPLRMRRLQAIVGEMSSPVLLSCLLASAVVNDEAAWNVFEKELEARGDRFGLSSASPVHQVIWRRLAGLSLEPASGVSSETKAFLSSIESSLLLSSEIKDEVADLS